MADGFTGMAQLIAGLARLPTQVEHEANTHVNWAADTMAEEVRNEYPVVSGNLRKGVKVLRVNAFTAQVKSTAKHAHLYERGTVRRYTAGTGANRGTMPAGNVFIPAAIKARAAMNDRLIESMKRLKVPGMTGTLDVVERGT